MSLKYESNGYDFKTDVWGTPYALFKAHRWLYHSTLGSRVIKKKVQMGNGYDFKTDVWGAPYTLNPES